LFNDKIETSYLSISGLEKRKNDILDLLAVWFNAPPLCGGLNNALKKI
jgi:hypothetical protein